MIPKEIYNFSITPPQNINIILHKNRNHNSKGHTKTRKTFSSQSNLEQRGIKLLSSQYWISKQTTK